MAPSRAGLVIQDASHCGSSISNMFSQSELHIRWVLPTCRSNSLTCQSNCASVCSFSLSKKSRTRPSCSRSVFLLLNSTPILNPGCLLSKYNLAASRKPGFINCTLPRMESSSLMNCLRTASTGSLPSAYSNCMACNSLCMSSRLFSPPASLTLSSYSSATAASRLVKNCSAPC
ncbi:hypothetical protein D3C77_537920 [compost metagenome]